MTNVKDTIVQKAGTSSPDVRPRRRRLLIGGLAAVAATLVALTVALIGGDDPDVISDATARTSAVPTDTAVPALPPTPTPTGPTENVDSLPAALPAVALDETAAVGDGIEASLPRIEAIQGSAVGPGNVSGPALRVTVRILNGTAQPVSVDGVAVNLAYGPDLTPASPLEDPSQSPFAGMVPPGTSVDAVYVFSVPEDSRSSVTVEVGYQAGAPLLLFTGSAP